MSTEPVLFAASSCSPVIETTGRLEQCHPRPRQYRAKRAAPGKIAIGSAKVFASNTKNHTAGTDETTPSNHAKLPYSTLAPTEIRLVNVLPGNFQDPIKIILQIVDLREEPQYDALSYVWHPQHGTPVSALYLQHAIVTNCNDFLIPLGANLDSAIRHLRHSPNSSDEESANQTLWIDALCINQDEISERNHQVGLMNKIYSSAQQVLIWLGPSYDDSDFVMDVLSTGNLASEAISRFMESLEILVRSEWFGRVWIAQELTLSQREPIINVGLKTIGWDAFSLAIQLVKARIEGSDAVTTPLRPSYLESLTKDTIEQVFLEGDAVMPNAVVARAELVLNLMCMRDAGPYAMFTEQFFRTLYLRSSDPRDKIFGLLGFSSFGKSEWAITPDYEKSTERVFAEAAAVIMQEIFYSYIEFELCIYQFGDGLYRGKHGWAPNMQLVGLRQGPKVSLVPPVHKVREALSASHGIAPLINFRRDFTAFSTVGWTMGRIVAFTSLSSFDAFFSIFKYLDKVSTVPDYNSMASVLLIPLGLENQERGPIIQILKWLHAEHTKESKSEFHRLQYRSNYIDRIQQRKEFGQLDMLVQELNGDWSKFFVTDTGVMGLVQITPDSIEIDGDKPSVVAGLFGINLPFVLQPLDNKGEYKMLRTAHLGDHKLGDEYIQSLRPGTGWEEVVNHGVMEVFTFL